MYERHGAAGKRQSLALGDVVITGGVVAHGAVVVAAGG